LGFSAGIEGGKGANLISLGTEADLISIYGNSTSYASIHLGSGKSLLIGFDTTMNEQASLFAPAGSNVTSLLVANNTIYLLRITDNYDTSIDRIAKFKVLEHIPGLKVTIRVDLMRDTIPDVYRKEPYSTIQTMYATDPISSSLDIDNRQAGRDICDSYYICNVDTDIDFNSYIVNGISSVVEGGATGTLVTLGTEAYLESTYALAARNGYPAVFGNLSAVYVAGNPPYLVPQNSSIFLSEYTYYTKSSPVVDDGIYVIHLFNDRGFHDPRERLIKLHIMQFVPDVKVSFRVEVMYDSASRGRVAFTSILLLVCFMIALLF
jgi:hypothetical protein